MDYEEKVFNKGGEVPELTRFPESNLPNPVHPFLQLVHMHYKCFCVNFENLARESEFKG